MKTIISKRKHISGDRMGKTRVKSGIQKWRKRGFHSEVVLVKNLQKHGYKAVRVPVSNPSLNPLPDIIARQDQHIYAFEVKKAQDYAYFPRRQVEKLFYFLDQLIPIYPQYKHAVLAAHFGKRWVHHEVDWNDWEKGELPEQVRVMKRDKGNFRL